MFSGIHVRVAGMTVAAVLLGFGAHRPAEVKLVRMTRHHAPAKIHSHRQGMTESYNWGGYAIPTANGDVTSVSGTWVVPTATCGTAENDTKGYAAFWVGIDGYSSNTVEQTGTDSDCVSTNGRQTDTPTYYAWFEFYPADGYYIIFPQAITPGDVMTATVTYDGLVTTTVRRGRSSSTTTAPEYTITITDTSKGNESYSTTAVVSGAEGNSAEWIVEAPCCENNGDVLPLADFNPWTGFTSTSATISGGAYSAASSASEEITMVGEFSSAVKAQPSTAAAGGAYTATWISAGP